MRLFTGIGLPPELSDKLARFVDRLRPRVSARWSPPSNFHITTKFIGEWPENKLGALVDCLKQVSTAGLVRIELGGLGHFPGVLYAAVKPSSELFQLAAHTDRALRQINVPSETRPYSPHVTLARSVKSLPSIEADEFGEFSASQFNLYLSKSGPVYTSLHEFPLVAQ